VNPKNFFAALKRRNVYKVAAAYAVVGWLVIQLASILLPTFEAPAWVMKVIVLVIGLGFPLALILAWAFELTPEGIKRSDEVSPGESIAPKTGRKLTALIVVIVLLAAGLGAFQLLRSKGPSAAAPDRSIAVLPFASLSEDKANAYFADGIQDEILTRLSKIAELKVISRTSTQQYQSKPGNLAEIARQLGVAHILEGSVQKSGDSVRVNVQLIKAEGDSHLWAETYDRKLTDIFAVETEVAQRIATSLEAKLTGREQQQVAAIPTKNPQAYDAYLRGLALITRQSFTDVRKAGEFFRTAIELDPDYAQAWAQLAIAESEIYFSEEQTQPRLESARRAAETAVRLQPELSETRSALGLFYYFCLKDFDRALQELEEARKRSPNDSTVHLATGLVKRRQGKLDEAIECLKRATIFDPRNPDIWANLARSYRGKRDFAAAREMFDRAFAISPDEFSFIGNKAEAYLAEGNLEGAENVLRDPKVAATNEVFGQTIRCLFFRHRFEEAAQAVEKNFRLNKETSPVGRADNKAWLGALKKWAGHESEGKELMRQALGELRALRDQGDTNPRLADALILTSAELGDRPGVEQQAAEMLRRTPQDLWRLPESKEVIAAAYATFGEADRAIPLLQEALSTTYFRAITPALLRLDPIWDKIRSDPRFQKLAEGKP